MQFSFYLRAALVFGLVSPLPVLDVFDDAVSGGFLVRVVQGQLPTIYYVDAVDGDDGVHPNDMDMDHPWATLARVQEVMGQQWWFSQTNEVTISLHADQVHYGSLNVPANKDLLIFNTYYPEGTSTGASPAIIDGSAAMVVTMPWISNGSNIYYTELDPEVNEIDQLDDKPISQLLMAPTQAGPHTRLTVARQPDRGEELYTQDAWLRIGMHDPDLRQITVLSAIPFNTGDWTDATLVVRETNWNYARRSIVAQSGSILTYDGSTALFSIAHAAEDARWGFYLEDKLHALTASNEWYQEWSVNSDGDPVLRVYVYSESAPPTGNYRFVRAQAPNFNGEPSRNGLRISGSQMTIDDLVFQYHNESGIFFDGGADQATVKNCIFRDLAQGIISEASNLDGHLYENNSFVNIGDVGMRSSVNNLVVRGNRFEQIGLDPGQLGAVWGGQALRSNGDWSIVEENVLNEIGYAGIELGGTNVLCQRNRITRINQTLQDGGAIQIDLTNGITVRENIIEMGNDNPYASFTTAPNYQASKPFTYGIYFGDKFIRNALIERNIVSSYVKGIHVDHTRCSEGFIIRDNVLFDNAVQLSISDYSNYTVPPTSMESFGCNPPSEGPFYVPDYDDLYQGNVLYCMTSDQYCVDQFNVYPTEFSELVDFGDFVDNMYMNPFSQVTHITSVHAQYEVPSDVLSAAALGLDERYLSWTLAGYLSSGISGTEPNAQDHPLRLMDHGVLGPTTPIVAHSDDGTNEVRWQETSTAYVADGGFLRFINAPTMRHLTAGRTSIVEPNGDVGTVTPPGLYRVTLRVRAADERTLHLAPAMGVGADQGIYSIQPIKAFEVIPDMDEVVVFLNLTQALPSTTFGLALHDPQMVFGVGQHSAVDVENVQVELVQDDPVFQARLRGSHLLVYNSHVAGPGDDLGMNVASTGGLFTLPLDLTPDEPAQCWSDIHGNFYAPGAEVQLEPWSSMVFYHVPAQGELTMDQNGEHHITNNTTWTDNINVAGSVIVDNGATLTIDGAHIGFAASTQNLTTNITVQPGGTLVLKNGATLRNWMGCGGAAAMWDGVKVLSSFDPEGPLQQTWPGQVRMESGARILNALVGVLCGEGAPANPGYANSTPGTYGGVIETTHAVFENNRFDVVAKQWVSNTGTPSSSLVPEPCQARLRFVNTTFRTTAPLLNTDLHPVAHLRVADNQPFVHGCTFANELPTHTSSLEMGHGIEALNANLRVGPCLSGPCLPDSDQGNTFRNLDHAIHAVATEGAPYSTIRDNTFTDNICGLYLKDLPGFDVRGNQLQMGAWDLGTGSYTNPDEEFWEGHHRAIFATGSNAFSIQDNTITRSPGNTTACEGIVVGYTGAENEVVFRNNATDLDRAYVGEGESADVNGDPNLAGLQFQCNTNADNAVNFTSRIANGAPAPELPRHTIRGRQGTPTYSASNSFGGALHFEVSTSADALVYVEYSHTSGQVPATYTVQDPFNLDADYLQPVLVNASLNCATDPPVWITGGSGTFTSVKPLLTSGKTEYGNLRYQYEQLIDGGNTDEVVQEIVDAWPQEILDLRARLLARSPYLSVASLKELMSKAGVPDAIRAEVLIANPDATKQDGFLRWAEVEAPYPLPGYLAQAVEASWNTRTYRTTLEEGLADKHTRLTQLVGHALHLLLTDSTPPPPDSLRWVWQQLRTNRARYSEAALLMGLGEYTAARDLVAAMPTEKDQKDPEEEERQRMLTYIGVLEAAAGQGRNAYRLNPSEVQQLAAMVDVHYDRPANWASNLLCAVYGQCRAPYTGGAGVEKSGGRTRDLSKPEPECEAAFSVQPNPARDHVVLRYDFGEPAPNARAVLRDPSGRIIQHMQLRGERGQQHLTLADLANGSYVIQYFSGEQLVHSERFVVQR